MPHPRKRLASSATGGASPLSPQGKALVWCNCRGPNDHQGSAPKRGNRGTVTPLLLSAAQGNDTNGTRLPIIGNKGVLRTIGSKRTFGDFSSVRKVTRRRQNTKRNSVGYRQNEIPTSAGQKAARPDRGYKARPPRRKGPYFFLLSRSVRGFGGFFSRGGFGRRNRFGPLQPWRTPSASPAVHPMPWGTKKKVRR